MNKTVLIDGRYAISVIEKKRPGEPQLIALKKSGWREVDGIRKQVFAVMALYADPVMLARDLVSDAIGFEVLHKGMTTISSYVAETRRLAEMTELALAELKAAHD